MEISYDALRDEVFGLLGDKRIMVLATSAQNNVTARSMSCVILNGNILFQTGCSYTKVEQMRQNPYVALCADNIQIEGVATIKGHPFETENAAFTQVYEASYKGSFDAYSHLKSEIVIEVKPTMIKLWKYEKGQPMREYLDIKGQTAIREFIRTEDEDETER